MHGLGGMPSKGVCMGGMSGQEVCMPGGVHAQGGLVWPEGHAWLGGVCGQGVCMPRGHACHASPPCLILRNMVGQ